MILITKALCIPVEDSTITLLLPAIKISARYQISRLLLLQLLLLSIHIQRKFNWREGGIIGRIGVTTIECYLTERYVWRRVSGTVMSIWFGLGGGPTTVNIISVTALYHIMTPLFISIGMFSVWLVHNNDEWLGYQLAAMITFMPMSIYKRHDPS